MTHTYVYVEVSSQTFEEVKKILVAADYGHAFHGDVIDMHGLALRSSPMPERVGDEFIAAVTKVQEEIYEWAKGRGWWEKLSTQDQGSLEMLRERELVDGDPSAGLAVPIIEKLLKHVRSDGELIALMHTELSEAMEGSRHHNPPSDKIPEFSALEEEFADTIIRILDFAADRKLRIAEAVVAKMKYNYTRPYRHGGKSC